jgi:hypothetical protein
MVQPSTSGGRIDAAGSDTTARWSLYGQAACVLLTGVLVSLDIPRLRLPGLNILFLVLFYGALGLGGLASISSLFAAVILRSKRWLLVPLVAGALALGYGWMIVSCCLQWQS